MDDTGDRVPDESDGKGQDKQDRPFHSLQDVPKGASIPALLTDIELGFLAKEATYLAPKKVEYGIETHCCAQERMPPVLSPRNVDQSRNPQRPHKQAVGDVEEHDG